MFDNSVPGLELCPKCKKGYLYPVVTARVSAEPKGAYRETSRIREYQCDICGHKQKPGKKMLSVNVDEKLSTRIIKTKKIKPKTKTKTKTKPKSKKTKSRSAQDLCANCDHARSSHKNELGESGMTCGWPKCDCKRFIE
jgi:hypothetical protein